jgi:hypothetical protein
MKKTNSISIIVLLTYLAMVIVNGLANALPINGMITGDISDSYPNLFAPTGITFIIWGVIYLLLAAHTAYQLGLFRKGEEVKTALLKDVGTLFSISSLANAAWIFAWHYKNIPLSTVFMLIILVSLALITIRINKEQLTRNEKFFIRLPFSVYFGWITVAAIANVTTLLVYLLGSPVNLLGLSEQIWTVIILLVGLLIGVATTLKFRDAAYGLVIVWGYLGILIKHLMNKPLPDGFNSQYPAVIVTVIISMVVLLAAIILSQLKAKEAK